MDEEPLRNPIDLPLVTLDNNALIALRENEPEATAVNELLAMNRTGVIAINIALSTGLEAGRGGIRWEWREHIEWLENLGIAKSNIFTGPRTIGFTSSTEPGVMIFDPELETQLNERVHAILFPRIPFYWYSFRDDECTRVGLSLIGMAEYDSAQMHDYIPPTPQHPQQRLTPHYDALSPEEQTQVQYLHRRLQRTWHNAKNDALGLYNHLTLVAHTAHPERSVFVTSDHHFLKASVLPRLRALGFKGEILSPDKAVEFLYLHS
jgi:hypothetical protein